MAVQFVREQNGTMSGYAGSYINLSNCTAGNAIVAIAWIDNANSYADYGPPSNVNNWTMVSCQQTGSRTIAIYKGTVAADGGVAGYVYWSNQPTTRCGHHAFEVSGADSSIIDNYTISNTNVNGSTYFSYTPSVAGDYYVNVINIPSSSSGISTSTPGFTCVNPGGYNYAFYGPADSSSSGVWIANTGLYGTGYYGQVLIKAGVSATTVDKTHSLDSYVCIESDKNHTADTLVQVDSSLNHSADTLVSADFSKTHNLDAQVAVDSDLNHGLDAYFQYENSLNHSLDGFVQAEQNLTHNLDADVALEQNLSHSISSSVQQDVSINHSISASVASTNNVSHSIGGWLIDQNEINHTIEVIPSQWQLLKTLTADGVTNLSTSLILPAKKLVLVAISSEGDVASVTGTGGVQFDLVDSGYSSTYGFYLHVYRAMVNTDMSTSLFINLASSSHPVVHIVALGVVDSSGLNGQNAIAQVCVKDSSATDTIGTWGTNDNAIKFGVTNSSGGAQGLTSGQTLVATKYNWSGLLFNCMNTSWRSGSVSAFSSDGLQMLIELKASAPVVETNNTHSLDASIIVPDTYDKWHLVDTCVQSSVDRVHNLDAYLVSVTESSKVHSINAYIQDTNDINHGIDTHIVVEGIVDLTQYLDCSVQSDVEVQHSIGGYIESFASKQHLIDCWVNTPHDVDATHSVDAWMLMPGIKDSSHSVDAKVSTQYRVISMDLSQNGTVWQSSYVSENLCKQLVGSVLFLVVNNWYGPAVGGPISGYDLGLTWRTHTLGSLSVYSAYVDHVPTAGVLAIAFPNIIPGCFGSIVAVYGLKNQADNGTDYVVQNIGTSGSGAEFPAFSNPKNYGLVFSGVQTGITAPANPFGYDILQFGKSAGNSMITEFSVGNAGGIYPISTGTQNYSYAFELAINNDVNNRHTVDALIKVDTSVQHTIDSALLAELNINHTADVLVNQQVDKAHSTDALLVLEKSINYSVDAYIQSVVSKNHVLDVVLTTDVDKAHSTDALLQLTSDKNHSTDLFVQSFGDLNQTIDGFVEYYSDHNYSIAGVVQQNFYRDHFINTLISVDTKLNSSLDTFVQAFADKQHSLSGYVQADSSLNHNLTGVVKVEQSKNHLLDCIIPTDYSKNHSLSALLAGSSDKQHGVDTYIHNFAQMTYPVPGSEVVGSTVTPRFTYGSDVASTHVSAGSTPGGTEYLDNRSAGVPFQNLPEDGSTVYVTFGESLVDGNWYTDTFTFITANGISAKMVSPVAGTALAGTAQGTTGWQTVNFVWDAGTGVDYYRLDCGSSLGGNDYGSSGQTNSTNAQISFLPTDGSTVYVRLGSYFAGSWHYNDYTYIACMTGSAEHTMTALVHQSVSMIHGIDLYIAPMVSKTHSITAGIIAEISKNHGIGSYVMVTRNLNHSVGGILQGEVSKTHGIDCVLVEPVTVEASHELAAIVFGIVDMNHGIDAIVLEEQAMSHGVDFWIMGYYNRSHKVEAKVQTYADWNHSIDAYVQNLAKKSHYTDLYVEYWHDSNHSVGVLINTPNVSRNHSVDALIRVGNVSKSHNIGCEVMEPIKTVTGTLGSMTSNKQANTLIFTLQNAGNGVIRVNGVGVVIAAPIKVTADSNGNFSVKLYGNDVITPEGTFYMVTFLDPNGQEIANVPYAFNGAGPFDLDSMEPYQVPQ